MQRSVGRASSGFSGYEQRRGAGNPGGWTPLARLGWASESRDRRRGRGRRAGQFSESGTQKKVVRERDDGLAKCGIFEVHSAIGLVAQWVVCGDSLADVGRRLQSERRTATGGERLDGQAAARCNGWVAAEDETGESSETALEHRLGG